jgi:hypothetical protein
VSAPPPAPGVASPGLPLACPCGAKPRAGFDLVGKRVKCPSCRGSLQVPDRAAAAEPVADPASTAASSCTICLSSLGGGLPAVRCPACRLAYHAECWTENGGCGAFGCPLAPEAPKETEAEGAPVQTAWGDKKKCPKCGKEIQAIAIKCRHCRADLGTRDAVSSKEWRERERQKNIAGKGRPLAIVAFLCSATCIGMPAGIGIALYHLWPEARRRDLEPADRFLHAGALVIAALYLALLFLIRVAGW